MTAVAAIVAQTLACIGFGAVVLRILELTDAFDVRHLVVVAFAIGLGVLGWLVFPLSAAGWISDRGFWTLLGLGALGLLALRNASRASPVEPWSLSHSLIFAGLAVVLGFDVLEALAPPTDGDSLAYHFTRPKSIIRDDAIGLVPHAVTGVTPMLIQMTYVPVLLLGEELGLTGWTFLSGWAAVALIYVVARQSVSRSWALMAALVFATTPLIVYAAGSGQVEVRIMLFVVVAAWAAGRAVESGEARYAVLAGLCAGFFAGAKLTGPVFVIAVCLFLLCHRRRFTFVFAAGCAAAVAGLQWYIWNWAQTGDPLFPFLFPILGVSDPTLWNAEQHAIFNTVYDRVERPFEVSFLNWLVYPFAATFAPPPEIEGGRAGLGPFAIVAALPAAVGAWACRDRIRRSPLLAFAAIAVFFYTLAFFMGSPQRVRHFAPVWPLLVIVLIAGAARCADRFSVRWPITGGAAAVVAIQMGGVVLFGANFAPVVSGSVDRSTYLRSKINAYAGVEWINANLGLGDRVATEQRTQLYYLDVPFYFIHPNDQAVVPWRHDASRSRETAQALVKEGITHLQSFSRLKIVAALESVGCLKAVHSGEASFRASRTLSADGVAVPYTVFRIDAAACRAYGDG